MSEPDEQGTQQPPPDGAETPDTGVNWGRVLDAAGILAGVFLILIVADIWSDGRLISRRLLRGREQQEPAPDAE